MARIADLLSQGSTAYADKTALIFKDQEISFQDLAQNVGRYASILQDLGVQPGDKVAFQLPNCPQTVYTYLACFLVGAVGVPLDFMLKSEEVRSCLDHSEAKLFITMARRSANPQELMAGVSSLQSVFYTQSDVEDAYNLDKRYAAASPDYQAVEVGEDDPALIMYTSGTTGRPKGIQLNMRHLAGSPEAMKHFVDLSDNDVKLAAIPFSHIGGFIYIQNCINFGITLVIMDRFQPFEFLANVERYKVTCFHIVPPMYNALLTLKEIERFDLTSLRWVVVFGAPSSPEILKRFHKYIPNAKLLNGWGMTETTPPNTVTPLDSDNIQSVGKPAPNCQIRIVDEDGTECPVGTIGEITISGWVVMQGYYKDPEETQRVLRDGWLYTGDLGRFDDEGYLYIVGRKKEMIKVAGQIVYAPEVEAALMRHEQVVEAAVIGVEDQLKGEAVRAFVVLHDGSPLTDADLRDYCRDQLANFKVPQQIIIKSELPKNRTGKIDKVALKEQLSVTGGAS